MILLFFIYIDVAISRYRFYIIVNSSFLFHRRYNCYIARILLFRIIIFYITFRVAFYITLFFL